MDNGNPLIIFYIVGLLLAVVLFVFIIRAVLRIPSIVKNLNAQTSLLLMIAQKQGVDIEKIQKIEAYLNYEVEDFKKPLQ